LKQTGAASDSLDLIELGALVVEALEEHAVVRRCYPVVVRISVEASDEDEARLPVERLLVGGFDWEFVGLIETKGRPS